MMFEGIGEVTAWVLRAPIGCFDRFKNAKQLCRYCGLSPKNTASGERQTQGGLIAAADKQLRAILIQAGRRLIRTESRWKQLAARLMRQGKPKNVAVGLTRSSLAGSHSLNDSRRLRERLNMVAGDINFVSERM
jgi:transposase